MPNKLPTDYNEWNDYVGPNGVPRISISPPAAVQADPLNLNSDPAVQAYQAKLPIKDVPKPTTYIMEPDLIEAQTGKASLPPDVTFDDAGFAYNKVTGNPIKIIRRPNVLPIARTPDGDYTLAMPKLLDLASNIMGGIGAPAVATKAGEVVLGSGAVKTAMEAPAVAQTVQPFYSALEQAVNNSKVGKASPEQWLGYLKNQPGVKSEEIATVLKDLPEGPITKSEMQGIVQNNKVQLGETTLGGKGAPPLTTEEFQRVRELLPKLEEMKRQGMSVSDIQKTEMGKEMEILNNKQKLYNNERPIKDTKYHGYQLPGSEPGSYKEMLMTLPEKKTLGGDQTPLQIAKKLFNDDNLKTIYDLDEGKMKILQKELDKIQDNIKSNAPYKSSHWDDVANPVAHARYNERVIDSKRGLHVEENQSDLHQAGRDRGYVGEKEKLQPEFDKVEKKLMDTNDEKLLGQPTVKGVLKDAVEKKIITKEEADTYKRYTDIENQTPVPDLPFKKNWEELVWKRMLHEAAVKGHDFLSWTPGEAQALRYQNDVRTKLDTIDWHNKSMGKVDPSGNKQILVTPAGSKSEIELTVTKNGEIIKGHPELKGKMLDSVLGKDLAKQVLEKSEGSIDAKGYVMNSEGMKAAYDKRAVDILNNIAKKYGSKVEQRYLAPAFDIKIEKTGGGYTVLQNNKVVGEFDDMKSARELEAELKQGKPGTSSQPIHYLPITPELRAKAKSGFPLFSSSPTLTAVSHDPFNSDKQNKYRLTPVQGNPFQ